MFLVLFRASSIKLSVKLNLNGIKIHKCQRASTFDVNIHVLSYDTETLLPWLHHFFHEIKVKVLLMPNSRIERDFK